MNKYRSGTKLSPYAIKLGLLFLAYFALGTLGLNFDPVSGFATLVWAPSGLSLAALLIFGYRLWPAITLAAFLVNLTTGAPVLAAVGICIGNTLGALVGVFILKKTGFRNSLLRAEDVVKLLIFGAFLSTIISATIGTSSLLVTSVMSASAYGSTWSAWWVGDMLGDLIVAPLLLCWASNPKKILGGETRIEFILWLIATAASGLIVFGQVLDPTVRNSPLSYLVFPPLIWGALRFNLQKLTAAIFILALLAIWGTSKGLGPFVKDDLSESLFLIQFFIGVVAFTTLVLTTVTNERNQSQAEVYKLNFSLARKVKEVERLNKIMVGAIKETRVEKIKANAKNSLS